MRRIRRWRDKTIQVGSKWIQEILPLLHHRTQLHCCSLRAQQGIRVSLPSSLNEACFAAEICSLPSCPSQFKNQDSTTNVGQAAGVIFRTVANPSWASGVLVRVLLKTYGLGSYVQGKGASCAHRTSHRRRTGGAFDCASDSHAPHRPKDSIPHGLEVRIATGEASARRQPPFLIRSHHPLLGVGAAGHGMERVGEFASEGTGHGVEVSADRMLDCET
jgi:hypothetical protein